MLIIATVISICFSLVTSCKGGASDSKHNSMAESELNGYELFKNDTLSLTNNSQLFVEEDIDLNGEIYSLPKGVTIIPRGGVIRNGTLLGNNTRIQGNTCVFDKVKISGTWDVPCISTDMFKNLDDDNALKNVFALTSKDIKNVVIIEPGKYLVSATMDLPMVISIPSNTEVVLNGIVVLAPNDLTNYYIFDLTGENISIHGQGSIIGDKSKHTGKSGEWGMGINLHQCNNISISDIIVKDCWGDCIYVGGKSNNVHINNCKLDNGRRQGISITSADSVYISNCTITNIAGTLPEYAIDVEPNQDDTIRYVCIANCKALNCKGGFMCWGGAKNACIESLEVTNCYVDASNPKHHPYSFAVLNSMNISDCIAIKGKFFFEKADMLKINNNRIVRENLASWYIFKECNPESIIE